MRINLRKALALIVSLLMLCTIIPMGAMTSVSAADANLSMNWNDGAVGFDKGNVVTEGPDGSKCFKWSAAGGWSATYITVKNMDPAKDYVITMKAKASVAGSMGTTIQNGDWGSYWNGPSFAVTTAWQDVTVEIPANTYPFTKGSILFKFQDTGAAMDLYVDDLVIAEKVEEVPETPAAGENLVINGDFENGTNGWSTSSAATIVSGGRSGSAIQLNNPSAWSEAARQDISVEADTEYTLTWYAKRVSGSGVFNFEVAKAPYDGTKPTVTAIENQTWMNETSGNWVKYQVKIKTTDSNGNGITGIMLKLTTEATNPGVLLMDDITLTKNATASFDGFLTNGDFEVGTAVNWEAYHGSTASTTAKYEGAYGAHLKGNGSWGGIFSQGTVNVVAGKTYILSYYIKVVKNGINLQIKDGTTSSGSVLISQQHPVANYGSWTQVTHEITPTKNGFFINFCGIGGSGDANASLAEEAYVDSIKIIEKPAEPVSNGYIENGDFETGNKSPWTTYSSTTVNGTAKYEGNYGLYIGGDGGWGGLAYQQINNLQKDQEYTITMWVKVVAGGFNVQVKGSDLSGDSIVAQYRSTSNSNSWTAITMKWTADATTGYINICGDGTGTAVVAYVDSVVVSRVGGEIYPEDKLTYGGSSIRETFDGVAGLAFRFVVTATDCQRTSLNEYKERSGKVTLGDSKYTLVRFGAVLTNQQSMGNTQFTLADVNGRNTIEIQGTYLASLSSDEVAFAVRVVDIPSDQLGREIYARPYYVYEKNGIEEIVYGAVRSSNYNKANGTNTVDKTKPIKILSIGHSFSKDVMTTNLYNMFMEGGYTDVTIGYLYMAGCSMPKHLYNIQNNLAQYEYSKNNSGTWVTKNGTSALTALKEEEWDFVTVQSSPDYIGGQPITGFKLGINNDGTQINLSSPQTEYEAMDQITDWIKANATNPDVKIDYHMIWSFSEGCNLWSYTYHNWDQMTMYNNIVNITQQNVKEHEDINSIIPSATAIQNARSSFMGDSFNMPDATQGGSDGYHLNDYGDYVAALTWYCHYSGDNAFVMEGYTSNDEMNLSAAQFEAIAEAVNNAIDIPFAVTQSSHKTAE